MSQEKRRYYSLSVHELVDVLLRAGDIDNRVYNQETMSMGSIMHAAFQKKQGNEYLSEFPLTGSIELEDATFVLQGRADGIIVGGPYPIIDEIKSTVMDLEEFHLSQKKWHLGQAIVYAYLFLKQKGGGKAGIRLTYLSQIDSSKAIKNFTYTYEELEAEVLSYCRDYHAMRQERFDHLAKRDASAKSLAFPFDKFRKGQRDLAKYVFGTIKSGGLFLAEAPTGTGKTISTLFPAVKSLSEGKVDRIFYLTAKNTGSMAAYEAVGALREKGLVARDSYLTSKEKICFCPGKACNPDECPYAKNYYSKLRECIDKAVKKLKRYDPLSVEEFCKKEAICPFEFQLDLSLEADIIIGDYNYFIDPIVYLQRYFSDEVDSSKNVVLIDEAHNLIDRTRDSYSASLSLSMFTKAAKSLKGDTAKSLRQAVKKLRKAVEEVIGEEEERILPNPTEALPKAIESFRRSEKTFFKKHPRFPLPPEVKDLSREAGRYLRIAAEHYDASYKAYAKRDDRDPLVKLYCIDPSSKLRACFNKVKAVVAFSATLSPFDYFESAITGANETPSLLLPSPFPKENFRLLIAPGVSTRFKDRRKTMPEVAAYLDAFVSGSIGNYFIYFPSYEYLETILPMLSFGDAEVVMQEKSMDRASREEFLSRFERNPKKTTIGLLVLGGPFSEGIDMTDDRLIGVAVVGVGMPQIGFDNDLIRSYYDENGSDGFSFAYKNPGMNKVLQAVGRLIRSETDRGVALLIDDRYLQEEYRSLMQRVYPDYEVVLNHRQIAKEVKIFFEKKGV